MTNFALSFYFPGLILSLMTWSILDRTQAYTSTMVPTRLSITGRNVARLVLRCLGGSKRPQVFNCRVEPNVTGNYRNSAFIRISVKKARDIFGSTRKATHLVPVVVVPISCGQQDTLQRCTPLAQSELQLNQRLHPRYRKSDRG